MKMLFGMAIRQVSQRGATGSSPQATSFVESLLRQAPNDRHGEVFLNAFCASGSDLRCCRRTEWRRNPRATNCLPTVRTCNVTPKRASTLCFRSAWRQRTTPSIRLLKQSFSRKAVPSSGLGRVIAMSVGSIRGNGDEPCPARPCARHGNRPVAGCLYDQAVAVLHQRMADEAQHGPCARDFL